MLVAFLYVRIKLISCFNRSVYSMFLSTCELGEESYKAYKALEAKYPPKVTI